MPLRLDLDGDPVLGSPRCRKPPESCCERPLVMSVGEILSGEIAPGEILPGDGGTWLV